MTVTEQAQAAQVEKLVRELIGRPKALVGMDLHSRKVTLTVADWVYGADPIVKRRFLDVSLDALESTYTRNVSKDSLTIIEASTNSLTNTTTPSSATTSTGPRSSASSARTRR